MNVVFWLFKNCKKKVFFISMVVVFTIFFVLYNSVYSPRNEKVLCFNIGTDPATMDPQIAKDLKSMTMARMFFEGLTRMSRDQKPELALAEEVEISPDGRIYTFALKNSIWSNGEPITSYDFINSWKKVLDPLFPSAQVFHMYGIKNAKLAKEGGISIEEVGIRALDAKRVEIELIHPTPYFLELLSLPIFFPVFFDKDKKHQNKTPKNQLIINSGPFLLKEWKRGSRITVVKNPHYWDNTKVKLGKIEFIMVNDTVERALFEKGEIDWLGSPFSDISIDTVFHLKKEKKLQAASIFSTYFFRINTEATPFQSPLIRKAFALTLNKLEVVDFLQGGQVVAQGMVPPKLFKKQKISPIQNTESIKHLLKKGMEELKIEKFPEVVLTYEANERNHLIAQVVQQEWQAALGITISLQAFDPSSFYETISKKKFQISIGRWIADYNDPLTFLEIFKYKNGEANNTFWENRDYQKLLNKVVETRNFEERERIFCECEYILAKEVPVIPIFYDVALYAKNQNFEGFVFSRLGNIDLKSGYINEKNIKKKSDD
jgi:oligopeptide transport system substrate-binding protein